MDYVAEPADLFVLLNELNCSLGSGGTSPGSKVAGREAEYTPPSCAEVDVGHSYTSVSSLCLHDLLRNNFTFTFYSLDGEIKRGHRDHQTSRT